MIACEFFDDLKEFIHKKFNKAVKSYDCLMKDKHTGKRRGFGFVEMSANAADAAVVSLNDTEFQQRTLKVREAKERPEKSNEE